MILTSRLDKKYQAEAVNTAVYLLNRRLNGVTPFELWKGYKPDLSHIRTFGCEAWKKTEDLQRKKLEGKSERPILLGFEKKKSYLLLDPQTGKIEFSCSAIPNEKEVISENYVFWKENLNDSEETTEERKYHLTELASKHKKNIFRTQNNKLTLNHKKMKKTLKEVPQQENGNLTDPDEIGGKNYFLQWTLEGKTQLRLTSSQAVSYSQVKLPL